MAKAIHLGHLSLRLGAGLAGLGASAVVIVAVLTVPIAGAQAKAAPRTVTPVPATVTAACPGPLLDLNSAATGTSEAAGAAAPAAAGSALTAVGSPAVVSGGQAKAPGAVSVSAPDVVADGSAPRAFQAPAAGTTEPLLAAAQATSVRTADLRGIAMASCTQPDYEQWLVGGSTTLGATSLIVLTNPGQVAATANIDVYTEQGLVHAAGGHGIVVPPHTQHVVPLSGLAPNASATAVHVTSSGGTVSAQLQESQVTGVTPQGVEWVGPTAAAAKHLVIPGAVIDTTALANGSGSDAGDGGVPVLRVLPVGTADAKLTISAKPEAGTKSSGMASSVTVSHGVVSEVPLNRLGAGTYTVTVDSSTPVVAAVHTLTVDSTAGVDFAWYAAAQPLTGAAAIPIARGAGAKVHLVNPTGSAVSVKLTGAIAATVKVPAGASVYITPGKRFGVLSTGDAHGIYASVSYAVKGAVSAYVAYPTGASAAALTVYRR